MSVSVIICAYSHERHAQLNRAIKSVLAQSHRAGELIVVVDHNLPLLNLVSLEFTQAKVIPNSGVQGLSGARNTGIEHASGDIIAFLDDDAIAEPDWLAAMVDQYENPSVIGTGGKVVPLWQVKKPRWFPEEFYWVLGCSYRGQPTHTAQVRNPIGCNMSFRRSVFERVGGFREGIGRTRQDAAGCEETELCIRARQAISGAKILYDPSMVVYHQVTSERLRFDYFWRRCLAEGRSKMQVANAVGVGDALSSERAYVTITLPLGVLRSLAEAFLRFDLWGLARAGSILAGLSFTTAGYVSARLAQMARPA
ncbi:family 2 glycosyl transferase [Mesorhizobium soli]|uniref:Family 2 glycosyl transferase n=1 Tax=Pseudaminobacter soli (ex Li et al. 2025) TaxID=1295366 RepID=A0A2P7RUC3_9HYPH|nr:family 2 glycosyl transferase [Mesorhizobium soli]